IAPCCSTASRRALVRPAAGRARAGSCCLLAAHDVLDDVREPHYPSHGTPIALRDLVDMHPSQRLARETGGVVVRRGQYAGHPLPERGAPGCAERAGGNATRDDEARLGPGSIPPAPPTVALLPHEPRDRTGRGRVGRTLGFHDLGHEAFPYGVSTRFGD